MHGWSTLDWSQSNNTFCIGMHFSCKLVYVREDEWLTMLQLFSVDVELRRELTRDVDGHDNVTLIPGMLVAFIIVSHVPQLLCFVKFLSVSNLCSMFTLIDPNTLCELLE